MSEDEIEVDHPTEPTGTDLPIPPNRGEPPADDGADDAVPAED